MNAAIFTRLARRGTMVLNIVGQSAGSKVAVMYRIHDRDGGSMMGCKGEFAPVEAAALANRMVAEFGCGNAINTVR